MTSPESHATLGYRQDGRRKRRLPLGISILCATVALLALNSRYRWDRPLSDRVSELYWQWRVAHEHVPVGTIAFDSRAAYRAGSIVPSGSWSAVYVGDCGGASSAAWSHFSALLPPAAPRATLSASPISTSYVGPGPTLFAGRLRSAAGDRIVHVSLNAGHFETVGRTAYTVDVTVVTPATPSRPPTVNWLDHDYLGGDFWNVSSPPLVPTDWTSADLSFQVIDRGTVDPNNAARFTCDFATYYGRRHCFEGVLSPTGDRVTFRFAEPEDAAAPNLVPASGVIAGPQLRR